MNRQWSTSLPSAPATLVTAASAGSARNSRKSSRRSRTSFGAWFGVTGTTFNATTYPGLLAPLARVTSADSCTNDQESNVDGLNTICFNQPSDGFTSGVLAFTRVIAANSPGASVGSGPPAAFAGQILDADTLFRNDGQATFATPPGSPPRKAQALMTWNRFSSHELGHWFALDHSGVWRSIMFPFAPPPGQFLGDRPTAQAPDGPLADDDRTGIRSLYPDPNDSLDIGAIRGPGAASKSLCACSRACPVRSGTTVTGIFGAQVVAVDAATGAVIAGTLSGLELQSSEPARAV